MYFNINIKTTMELLERALTLSRSCEDIDPQCNTLLTMADIKMRMGDVCSAQIHVNEARRLATMSGYLYQEARQCSSQLCVQLNLVTTEIVLSTLTEQKRFLGSVACSAALLIPVSTWAWQRSIY
jgi:hypothetical protein